MCGTTTTLWGHWHRHRHWHRHWHRHGTQTDTLTVPAMYPTTRPVASPSSRYTSSQAYSSSSAGVYPTHASPSRPLLWYNNARKEPTQRSPTDRALPGPLPTGLLMGVPGQHTHTPTHTLSLCLSLQLLSEHAPSASCRYPKMWGERKCKCLWGSWELDCLPTGVVIME